MASFLTPKFVYPSTSGTVFILMYPMRHWTRRQQTVGGHRVAAAGHPNVAARTVRRDYLLDVVLRLHETELDAAESLIAWAQDNPATTFDFLPHFDGTAGSYPSYLISPVQEEEFTPQRNSEVASVFETTLTFKRSTGASWPFAWYSD